MLELIVECLETALRGDAYTLIDLFEKWESIDRPFVVSHEIFFIVLPSHDVIVLRLPCCKK